MHKKISKEQIAYMEDQFLQGRKTYTQIAMDLATKFGISVSSDTVRYFVTRKKKVKQTYRQKLKNDGIEKVLVLSDLHIPFQREDILDVVKKHKHEVSTIIFGGFRQ